MNQYEQYDNQDQFKEDLRLDILKKKLPEAASDIYSSKMDLKSQKPFKSQKQLKMAQGRNTEGGYAMNAKSEFAPKSKRVCWVVEGESEVGREEDEEPKFKVFNNMFQQSVERYNRMKEDNVFENMLSEDEGFTQDDVMSRVNDPAYFGG